MLNRTVSSASLTYRNVPIGMLMFLRIGNLTNRALILRMLICIINIYNSL